MSSLGIMLGAVVTNTVFTAFTIFVGLSTARKEKESTSVQTVPPFECTKSATYAQCSCLQGQTILNINN